MSPIKFEFLSGKWLKIEGETTLINRDSIDTFEYEGSVLEIYVGIRCIKRVVDQKEFDRFKGFVLYGCTL
jgi:hypothetical protein